MTTRQEDTKIYTHNRMCRKISFLFIYLKTLKTEKRYPQSIKIYFVFISIVRQ